MQLDFAFTGFYRWHGVVRVGLGRGILFDRADVAIPRFFPTRAGFKPTHNRAHGRKP